MKFLSENKYAECGRFTHAQMDRALVQQQQGERGSINKMLIAASAAVLVTGLAKGQAPNTTTNAGTTNASGMILQPSSNATKTVIKTLLSTISGKVTDAKTKLPIGYAEVHIRV